MQSSSAPDKISVPFAQNGDKQTIPVESQIGTADGRASYNDGFPPITRIDILAGGVPPFGTDFNGVLYAITNMLRWQNAGGVPKFDSVFSTSIGGYPKGAVLQKATGTGWWISTVENNTSNPDGASPAGWADAFAGVLAGLGSMAYQNSGSVSITGGAISGIADLSIADGGTGASTAVQALYNLGGQPWDATLSALAEVATAADKLIYATGPDAFSTTALTEFARNLIAATDALTARNTLGLSTGATSTVTTSRTDSNTGRLLKTGDFGTGFGYAPGLQLVSDASGSLVDATGIYAYSNTTVGKPGFGSGYGVIQQFSASQDVNGNYGAQLAIDYASNNIGFRRLTGGAGWSSWYEMYHTGNVGSVGQQILSSADPVAARNAIDVYGRSEVYTKADVYTKAEAYSKSEVYAKTEVYNKTEVLSFSFGVNQSLQDVTASRALGTNYTNTTGKAIAVYFTCDFDGGSVDYASAYVDGFPVAQLDPGLGRVSCSFVVPPGSIYAIQKSTYPNIVKWIEMR